jgi:hypothetical protein
MNSRKILFTAIALTLIFFCASAQQRGYLSPWPGFVVDSTGISFKGTKSTRATPAEATPFNTSGPYPHVEVGALATVSNTDMEGLQLASLANVSNCSLTGVQLSTLSNYNSDRLTGAQISIVSNVTQGDINGVQLAAYSNVTKGNLLGAQVSSFSNVAIGNTMGAQVSGFVNVAQGDLSMVQTAGLLNLSQTIKGPQFAGMVNVATRQSYSAQIAGYANYAAITKGVQLAGFANIASAENAGVQLAVFFNYATINKGTQLAFFNYADSSSGVPVGFFSYVKKGYHVLEISSTETFPATIAFKTGVKRFYNIFEAGFAEDNYHLGYGVGTLFPLGQKLSLSLDLTANHVGDYSSSNWDRQRFMARFNPAFNFQAFKKVGVAIGPTLNFYIAETASEGNPSELSNYHFSSGVEDDYSYQAWLGARLAIRFF